MKTLITVADVAKAKVQLLDVLCSRCERHGRISVERLLRELGPEAPIGAAWKDLNANCDKRHTRAAGQACDLYAPVLQSI